MPDVKCAFPRALRGHMRSPETRVRYGFAGNPQAQDRAFESCRSPACSVTRYVTLPGSAAHQAEKIDASHASQTRGLSGSATAKRRQSCAGALQIIVPGNGLRHRPQCSADCPPRSFQHDHNPLPDLKARRERLVLDHFADETRQDFDAVLATFPHPHYELIPSGEVHDGIDTVRQYYIDSRLAFPDQRHEIIQLRHTDDAVIVEFWLLGTHRGPLRGLPPTGNAFRCRMIALFIFEGSAWSASACISTR